MVGGEGSGRYVEYIIMVAGESFKNKSTIVYAELDLFSLPSYGFAGSNHARMLPLQERI